MKSGFGSMTRLSDRANGSGEESPSILRQGEFYRIDPNIIQPNPFEPRKIYDEDDLAELTESVRAMGVIQPLLVKLDGDRVILSAGSRRLIAAKRAGLQRIPVVVTGGDPILVSLIENLQRADLKPIEEAEALQRAIDEFGYSQSTLAEVIGKSRSTINEILRLARMPAEVKERVQRADMSRRMALEISKQEADAAEATLAAVESGEVSSSEDLRRLRKPPAKRRSQGEQLFEAIWKVIHQVQGLKIEQLTPAEHRKCRGALGEMEKALATFRALTVAE